jgi:hypothetical protein
MSKIKTFQQACEALGVDANALPDFSMIPEGHRKAMMAHYKLVIIVEAVNKGWKPDWPNHNEVKYELWLNVVPNETKPSGVGLSFSGAAGWGAYASVGSRLCFKNRELAEHTFETFKGLYEDYLLIG